MKAVVAILLVSLAVASAAVFSEEEYQFLFTKWAQVHNREYSTYDEFFKRFNVFKSNLDYVHQHSLRNSTHTLKMNQFGDMTNEEFKAFYNGAKIRSSPYLRSKNVVVLPTKNLPSSVNWPSKGVVTPVKNQGQCGSCWAFSTTGSTEGAFAIATGQLVSLSEQQLVDCSGAEGNQGCNGGLMDQAFQYIIDNGGITTEKAYPYTAEDGTCNTDVTPAVAITGFSDVTSGDEDALAAAVALGPVSVAIEADQACFQFYSGGVLSDPSCGTQLDHGVLAVGYDTTGSQPYWIVKNSWGTSWGMSGYVLIAKGSDECGIATEPSYPTGAKKPGSKPVGRHHRRH